MNAMQFNLTTAEIFRRCAEVLRRQDANPFRVSAYLHAAETKGPLTGRRVIRGREAECRALAASAD